MKFHINRKEALSAARKAALAVPENSPIAEFTGILLEANAVSYTHLTLPTICSV